jgi:hypothetical protein
MMVRVLKLFMPWYHWWMYQVSNGDIIKSSWWEWFGRSFMVRTKKIELAEEEEVIND